LFSDLNEEDNVSKTSVTSSKKMNKDKSKHVDEAIMKKFEKDNKMVRGHLLNHITNPLCHI